MGFQELFIFFFGFVALVCAFGVVFLDQAILSALSLLLVLISLSGIYALLGAHLIAGLQILVYAGAILVLFVFVIMLLNPAKGAQFALLDVMKRFVLIALLLGVFAFILWTMPAFKESAWKDQGIFQGAYREHFGNTRALAIALFSEYLLPFEVTSFLLLSCVAITVGITKRENVLKMKQRN
jgi:NADH-quinone oxidoreductase subunit J